MMQQPEHQKAPFVDHNREAWTAFLKNDEEAKKELKTANEKFSKTHLIVSSTYKFIAKYHDGNIYQFFIVKAQKKT